MNAQVRLVTGHSAACTWMQQAWRTPWWFPGHREYHNKLGYGAGMHGWIVARCNITGCPAKALVQERDLAMVVQQSVARRALAPERRRR